MRPHQQVIPPNVIFTALDIILKTGWWAASCLFCFVSLDHLHITRQGQFCEQYFPFQGIHIAHIIDACGLMWGLTIRVWDLDRFQAVIEEELNC